MEYTHMITEQGDLGLGLTPIQEDAKTKKEEEEFEDFELPGFKEKKQS